MVEIGDQAPLAIVRKTTTGEVNIEFNLQQAYTDDIVIFYFFPAAFTGVCTESSCELRDDLKDFTDIGAEVYSISADMPFTHREFIKKYDINYPVLSDWNKEMMNAFDIVDNNFGGMKGVPKRSLFTIKNNRIIYKWVAEHPGKYPPFDNLKKTIQLHD